MERRKETRFPKNEPVKVTALGSDSPVCISGVLVDLAGSGLKIALPCPLPVGSPVKVEGPDFLLLGEVCRIEPEPGGCSIAVKVSHSLGSLAELDRLNRAILGSESRVKRRQSVY